MTGSGADGARDCSYEDLGELSDVALVSLMRDGRAGEPARAAACEALVRRHDRLVRACVNKYRDAPDSADDLRQVGYLGLMKAINNFDPEVGESLAAYAMPCISGEMKRYFRDKRWHVRVYRPLQELRLRIRGATPVLAQQLGREPADADLAAYLQVSEAEIVQARLAAQAFQASYLDAPVASDPDATTIGDLVGGEDDRLEQLIDMTAVWQHWAELPEREQAMLAMRFYGNMTQSQIGEQTGLSQMHVCRLLAHALGYLRSQLAAS